MVNISVMTRNPALFAEALRGKWERHAEDDVTWVILGQIAFVEARNPHTADELNSLFPYKVLAWHTDGTGAWGILE